MLWPFFLKILRIDISFSINEKVLSVLSKIISTDASFAGATSFVPIKIKLLAFAALIDFALNLPKTKHKPSDTLDFPLPFGPRTQLIPGVNGISVFLTKLLNPYITNFLIYAI